MIMNRKLADGDALAVQVKVTDDPVVGLREDAVSRT